MIDIGDVGQRIQVLNLRPVRIVDDGSIFPVGNPKDLFQRLALGEFNHGVIELLAADEINGWAIFQRPVGKYGDVRAYESNLDVGIRRLNSLRQTDVPREA